MAEEIKPIEKPVDYKPWFEAVRSGDWCKAKEFHTLHPSAITAKEWGRTALHIAALHGREQIVEELVQLMTEEQLEIQDNYGETALTVAAATNIKVIECLVAKNKKLLGIAKYSSKMTPILIAAENHRWDIVRYLYSETPLEDLKPDKGPWGSELVNYCLQAKQFDIVFELLDRCPGLGCAKGFRSYPIYEFAFLPSAFLSGTSLKCWQRWIYECIHVEHAPSVIDARINVQNQENEQGDQRNSTDSFEELRKLFISQHIFQTDRLHSADNLYTIRQKPDESLREYADRFSHEYSRCAQADDKTALKAFTAGLRDCFFEYIINANTWKTYSKVMTYAYNHTSAKARTYQGNLHMVNPYQQVGSGSQVLPSEEILAIQTPIASSPASFSYSLSHQTYLSLGKRKDFYSQQAHYNKRDKSSYQDN